MFDKCKATLLFASKLDGDDKVDTNWTVATLTTSSNVVKDCTNICGFWLWTFIFLMEVLDVKEKLQNTGDGNTLLSSRLRSKTFLTPEENVIEENNNVIRLGNKRNDDTEQSIGNPDAV